MFPHGIRAYERQHTWHAIVKNLTAIMIILFTVVILYFGTHSGFFREKDFLTENDVTAVGATLETSSSETSTTTTSMETMNTTT